MYKLSGPEVICDSCRQSSKSSVQLKLNLTKCKRSPEIVKRISEEVKQRGESEKRDKLTRKPRSESSMAATTSCFGK